MAGREVFFFYRSEVVFVLYDYAKASVKIIPLTDVQLKWFDVGIYKRSMLAH